MADLTITAASVLQGSGAIIEDQIAGAAITAGQLLYKDSADGKVKLADANSGVAEARSIYGVAVNNAAANQPVAVQRKGKVAIGATVAVGTIYVLSATAGGVAPSADLATGHYVSILGVAVSATEIEIAIVNSGALKP